MLITFYLLLLYFGYISATLGFISGVLSVAKFQKRTMKKYQIVTLLATIETKKQPQV